VFPTFLRAPAEPTLAVVSDNYRHYQQKMAQQSHRRRNGPLRTQLIEILDVVRQCEARWALEERIDRQLGRG